MTRDERILIIFITSFRPEFMPVIGSGGIGAIISEKIWLFNTKRAAKLYGMEEILSDEPAIVAELMKRYESLTKV